MRPFTAAIVIVPLLIAAAPALGQDAECVSRAMASLRLTPAEARSRCTCIDGELKRRLAPRDYRARAMQGMSPAEQRSYLNRVTPDMRAAQAACGLPAR